MYPAIRFEDPACVRPAIRADPRRQIDLQDRILFEDDPAPRSVTVTDAEHVDAIEPRDELRGDEARFFAAMVEARINR